MNAQLLTFIALAQLAVAAEFRVTVGISQITGQIGTGLDPNRIVPAAGDTIAFTWLIPGYIQNPVSGTYSVTQGSFENPCQPLAGGFESGPRTTGPESAGQAPTLTFQVKDDKPLYFYSSVADQCKRGMVLGVNTPASGPGSVEAYIIAAGGDPSVDTTTNSTTPATPANTTTSSNTTTSRNQTNTTVTASNRPTNSGSTNSTSAKPPNSAAALISPRSSFAAVGLFVLGLLL